MQMVRITKLVLTSGPTLLNPEAFRDNKSLQAEGPFQLLFGFNMQQGNKSFKKDKPSKGGNGKIGPSSGS